MNLSNLDYIPIEGHHINVVYSDVVWSEFDHFPVKAPALYGVIRIAKKAFGRKFRAIWLSQRDGSFFICLDGVPLDDDPFFQITSGEFETFLSYYCNLTLAESCWKTKGF